MLQQEIKFSYNGLTLIDFERIQAPSATGEHKWLIDGIWANAGTGIVAATPKTGKTWLMLEMAVAVASGKPFLGRFPTLKGPVLVFSPEGSPIEARDRFLHVLRRRSVDEDRCPVYFIRKNHPLCLSDEKDQEAIEMAVMEAQPKLLVFDPLAECFSGDENSSSEVKPVTSFLNRLAREHGCSVLLTHHTGKKNSGNGEGNSMRGSSALFAFGDSYLLLDKTKDDKVVMRSKQRNGKPSAPMTLELAEVNGNLGYEICAGTEPEETPKADLGDRILELLRETNQPMSLRGLRKSLGGTTGNYSPMLKELKDAGEIEKTKLGWEIKRQE